MPGSLSLADTDASAMWRGPPTKDVVGYSDRLSLKPGETIKFMVSCSEAEYDVVLVKLLHGDDNPEGPGFRELVIDTSVNGTYPGRVQELRTGSYVKVSDTRVLRELSSFTLATWIQPTLLNSGTQGIMSKYARPTSVGYVIYIDANDSRLSFTIGDSTGLSATVRSLQDLVLEDWYFVAATYDAETQLMRLYVKACGQWSQLIPPDVVAQKVQLADTGNSRAPFLIAAHSYEHGYASGFFNGKIDSPCVLGSALDPAQIEACEFQSFSHWDLGPDVVARWSLGHETAASRLSDLSGNNCHGEIINMPSRGVTGHNWSGRNTNWRLAPEEYGAIHFHDDDLEDAAWEHDFEFAVPPELESGVYAARASTARSEEYIPFFVRCAPSAPTAPIGFLIPTFTYLAYANSRIFADRTPPKVEQAEDEFVRLHGLRGLYDTHSDGSPVYYASRLKPSTMRPKYYAQHLGAPARLSADLCIVDWLDHQGYKFNVVTDDDLHAEGVGAIGSFRTLITGSHPEYWTLEMIEAIERFLSTGGKVAYLGGECFYWVTSVDPVRPYVMEVRRGEAGSKTVQALPGEYYHSTTGEPGGMWRFRNKVPQKLFGVGFTAWGSDRASAYHRTVESFDERVAFIFEGLAPDEVIGDHGLILGGAAGYEIDRMDYKLGTPANAFRVATSAASHGENYVPAAEEVLDMADVESMRADAIRADMVYFDLPGGGEVFSVGSICWCGALSYNNYVNAVSRITDNIIRKFTFGEDQSPSNR